MVRNEDGRQAEFLNEPIWVPYLNKYTAPLLCICFITCLFYNILRLIYCLFHIMLADYFFYSCEWFVFFLLLSTPSAVLRLLFYQFIILQCLSNNFSLAIWTLKKHLITHFPKRILSDLEENKVNMESHFFNSDTDELLIKVDKKIMNGEDIHIPIVSIKWVWRKRNIITTHKTSTF